METNGIRPHLERPLYRELACAIQARKGMSAEHPWFERWGSRIEMLTGLLPHGSGIDDKVETVLDASHGEKIVIRFSFHHMDENGFYDGWTDHTLTVRPSFAGISLRISGSNRNQVKDHLYDTFDFALRQDVAYHLHVEQFPQWKVRHQWEDSDGKPSECYQAFYVDGVRFWNNLAAAMNYAADQMENAFLNRGRGN